MGDGIRDITNTLFWVPSAYLIKGILQSYLTKLSNKLIKKYEFNRSRLII
jgi:hypothetical protein